MNIYLIKRIDEIGYDENAGHVVLANSIKEARLLASRRTGDEGSKIWLDALRTKITKVGTTDYKTQRIILSDFRAG